MGPADILMMNFNLFKKMKEMADKQEDLIQIDQMDEFIDLLNKRELIRREITANNRKYEVYIKNNPDKNHDKKTIDITNEISDMIRYIQEKDKRIEGILTSKKDILLNEIKVIRRGRNAVRGYGGTRQKINRFLNRKG